MPPDLARLALRVALGVSFLSAVADRFGLWGPPGAPGVAWGDFTHFVAYTGQLTRVAPTFFAWAATLAELGFGVLLVVGLRIRIVARLSGLLLSTFALSMLVFLRPKAPLDYPCSRQRRRPSCSATWNRTASASIVDAAKLAVMSNWFDQGGEAYARYRPTYPEALAAFLVHDAPGRTALDVGCGNGQLTCQLAEHLDAVVGVDPSADQLAHAQPHPRVRYACAPAEATGLPAQSVGLVTAAQAAHWFDLPRFHAEVRRVAIPGARIALVSYGAPELEPDLNDRFQRFYRDEIGPYWPAERALVDSGYATMDFPFAERSAPAMNIERSWTCAELLGYISTWSATRRAREANREDLLVAFGEALTAPWGTARRRVRWPVRMRLGVVE